MGALFQSDNGLLLAGAVVVLVIYVLGALHAGGWKW